MPAFNPISVTQVDLPSFPLHLTCMINNKHQVEDNFFDEMIFYRVIPGFLTQFGMCLFKRCASLYVPACCSNAVLHCDRLASAPTSLFLLQNCYCASPSLSLFPTSRVFVTSAPSTIHLFAPSSSHTTTLVCSLHHPTPPHRSAPSIIPRHHIVRCAVPWVPYHVSCIACRTAIHPTALPSVGCCI